MLPRAGLLLSAAAVACGALAQPCFTVVRGEDLVPLAGCIAMDRGRLVLGTSDAMGQLCLRMLPDTLVLECPGRAPLRLAANTILVNGPVVMRPAMQELVPLEVEPWPTRADRQALAATSTLDSALRHGFERSSLRSAVVWTPGVQWDQRGLGASTRLSIRGSLLRAPYGVRGVKVYLGPFPLTLADGSTPLELLDPALATAVDVVRSVGSPVFGSAPSGLLLARPDLPASPGRGITAELTGGSYGFHRLAVQAASTTTNGTLCAGLVTQGNDGYREQEWSTRQQAWLSTRWRTRHSTTQALVTVQQASWALPGSVDSLTALTTPRAARPYSMLVNAHVDKTQVLAGVFNDLDLGHGLRMRSGIHGQLIDKQNPYGTSPANNGYKDERIGGFGARLVLGGEHRLPRMDLAWEAGLEALRERDELVEHTYSDGVMGYLRTDATTDAGTIDPFLSVQAKRGRWAVHAALGGERYLARHDDRLRDTLLRADRRAGATPLAGLSYTLGRTMQVHLRYAGSTARPTVWELLGSTGTFNEALRPERVAEWEAGLDMGTRPEGPQVSVVTYAREIHGLIQAVVVDSSEQVRFENLGDADQKGVELSCRDARHVGTTLLSAQGFLALQHHRYQPIDGGGAYRVPGVPDVGYGIVVRSQWAGGSSLEAGWRGAGAVSANTLGTATVAGYGLMHLRLGHRIAFRGAGVLDLFLHGDNLLDQRYTSFVQLNDPGGRYYNPAPGRSFFAGASFAWDSRRRP